MVFGLVTSPSVKSELESVNTTSFTGCVFNFMVNVAVPRFSVVGLLIVETITPATSLSIFTAVTFVAAAFSNPEASSVEALFIARLIL